MRHSLVQTRLILAGNRECNVVPAIAPIIGETRFYPLRSFCQERKGDVWSLTYKVPCIVSPLVSFLNEKVASHTYTHESAAFQLVISGFILFYRKVEV